MCCLLGVGPPVTLIGLLLLMRLGWISSPIILKLLLPITKLQFILFDICLACPIACLSSGIDACLPPWTRKEGGWEILVSMVEVLCMGLCAPPKFVVYVVFKLVLILWSCEFLLYIWIWHLFICSIDFVIKFSVLNFMVLLCIEGLPRFMLFFVDPSFISKKVRIFYVQSSYMPYTAQALF